MCTETVLAGQLQYDPTGLSSPIGQVVILLGLLAALTVLIRIWWQHRNR